MDAAVNKIYIYAKCSTCRNALQWLKQHGIAHEVHPIRETPPSVQELERALHHHDQQLRRIVNTSGMDYRAMGLKDKLPAMSRKQALDMLAGNGNLVKRPLLLADEFVLAGFKPDVWAAAFGT